MPVQYGGELTHSQSELIRGKYSLNKLTARESLATIPITTVGGIESTFEIPTRPLNLARSVLRFTYTPTSEGGGTYNRVPMDCLPMIKTIELRSRSGQYLCNLQHVGNYTKMIWKPEISYDRFISLDNHGDDSGYGAMLQKCNADPAVSVPSTGYDDLYALSNTTAAVANVAAHTAIATAGGNTYSDASTNAAITDLEGKINTVKDNLRALTTTLKGEVKNTFQQPSTNARRHDDALIANGTGAPSFVNVAYEEAKYFEGGTLDTDDPVIKVSIPLGMLFGTIFEIDKTIGFNEILDLRIVWEGTNKAVFNSTDALSVGAGADITGEGAEITNLNLFLAVETDPNVILGVQQKIAGDGFSFKTEYPISWKTNLAAGTQSFVLKMNRSQGERIRRIYTSGFNNTESKNTAFDCDNRAQAKITSYYTTLDSNRIQQFDITCSRDEDYMLLKEKLKGSAILNSNVYKYNWFHVDFWDHNRPLYDKREEEGYEVAGLSLDTERRYEWSAEGAVQLNYYTYAILQRTIVVKGVDIMMS